MRTRASETYLLLVVEVHLAVRDLSAEAVHLLAELQAVLALVRRLVQLLGQVEVLAVQLGVLLAQLGELLLQVRDHLRIVGSIPCKKPLLKQVEKDGGSYTV